MTLHMSIIRLVREREFLVKENQHQTLDLPIDKVNREGQGSTERHRPAFSNRHRKGNLGKDE